MKSIYAIICLALSALALPAQALDLLQYVNTLQGSHNTPEFSHGRCSPLVGYPHGVNLWSPRGAGFSGGGISFAPKLGNGTGKNAEAEPKEVIAQPHYYQAAFENGISSELTSSERCGCLQFTFPGSQPAYLEINGHTSEMKIDPDQRTITGQGSACFIIQFDQPFVAQGSLNGGPGDAGRNGIYFEFKPGAKVQIKVALSSLSQAQAQTTFDREVGAYNFPEIKAAAGKVWNELLNQIVVEGGTLEQRKTFYSCLYRANLRPAKIYEIDQAGKPHFFYKGKVYDGYYHSNPILWDAFRCLFALQNILNPVGEQEYVQSLQLTKPLTGWWPSGHVMIGNHAISVFADAWAKGIRTFDPDTVLKYYYQEVTHSEPDLNSYNLEHQRGNGRMGFADYFALGYIPYQQNTKKVTESTSRTLEYTYDDFCAYQLAKMTGNKFYEALFQRQMFNYKNVFDPADHFMKGRDVAGHWTQEFNPYEWGGPFVEGNAWQWKWFAPHDVQGLIDLIGGEKQFAAELDELFRVPATNAPFGGYGFRIHEINEAVAADMGQYGGVNEPGFHIIYLYDYAGQPWKGQKLIRQSLTRLFNSGPDGFMGDEDGGAVSSWYVFSALGFYPVTPGVDQYALGSPLFDQATITLANGKRFIIVADKNSADNVYIQSATLNGKTWSKNWINHVAITNGGTLRLEMSHQPNPKRGAREEDKPFSVSRGH